MSATATVISRGAGPNVRYPAKAIPKPRNPHVPHVGGCLIYKSVVWF